MTRQRCEECGSTGGWDLSVTPASYRKQGRRGQGGMSPQWCPAEFSPLFKAVLCLACWRRRFWPGLRRAAA